MSYRDEYLKVRDCIEGDDLTETGEREKFGFSVEQNIEITCDGAFHGQKTIISAFTSKFVVAIVEGPSGEPSSEWWFRPEDIKAIE